MGYSSLGYERVGHNLATKQQEVCICQSQSPNLSLLPYPLVTISLFSTSVIESAFNYVLFKLL